MSSHHDDHQHSSEPKKVQFRTPMIMGIVTLIVILLALSMCDNKKHGCCEGDEAACEKSCEGKCESDCKHGHDGHESADTVNMEASHTTSVTEDMEVTTGTLDSLGNFVYNTGDVQTSYLADGAELICGKNSTETRLCSFLGNVEAAVDTVDKTKGWISLDRVYFEKGKSVLTKESEAQMLNIAKILKAYPTATIKIGGYTDNTGSEAVNVKVSGERAAIVLKALVKNGVAANRLKSEGYGPMHPIASNETPEGMAQNRRVDIRVTKK